MNGHHGNYGNNGSHHGGGGGYKGSHHGRSNERYYTSNEQQLSQSCPYCHASIAPQSQFCGQCGKNLAGTVCRCGATIASGAKFCGQCGNSI